MTVADLIERLKALPQDLLVLTPGFDEGGYRTVRVEVCELYKHEETFSLFDAAKQAVIEKARVEFSDDADYREGPLGIPTKVVVIDFE